jgi:hypothetical protein
MAVPPLPREVLTLMNGQAIVKPVRYSDVVFKIAVEICISTLGFHNTYHEFICINIVFLLEKE